ncbi:hypothetical protein ACFQZC_21195 [Streptacidiphilus monticola]
MGGGDPTLSSAGLSRLAADTARALRAAGTTSVRLGYDISAFAAPALHPIGVNENIALVQALTVDEGRIDPHSTENAPAGPTRRPGPRRSSRSSCERRACTCPADPRWASRAGRAGRRWPSWRRRRWRTSSRRC